LSIATANPPQPEKISWNWGNALTMTLTEEGEGVFRGEKWKGLTTGGLDWVYSRSGREKGG